MGGIWHQAGCCCPSCQCSGDQPDADVYVSGTCSGLREIECRGAAGIYIFDRFEINEIDGECYYIWTKGDYTLQARAVKDQQLWFVQIYHNPLGLLYSKSSGLEVICFYGTWAGVAILTAPSLGLCADCIATVDFGDVL